VAEHFRGLGYQVTGWFFNPNVHPRDELERREAAFEEATRALALPVLPPGPQMSELEFLLQLASCGRPRCHACYQLRLRETARSAAAAGLEAFSTTLLISPYQAIEAVREIGEAAGREHGVAFAFADLVGKYGESCARSRALGLYRQNYCGCQFSELERRERRGRRALGRAQRPAAGS
jgi:predicted adenine nucleotide alpha hydrolase (AANH) superfamily ATPase